jgi:hypothetical protein
MDSIFNDEMHIAMLYSSTAATAATPVVKATATESSRKTHNNKPGSCEPKTATWANELMALVTELKKNKQE